MTRLNKAAGKLLFEDVNDLLEQYLDGPRKEFFAGIPEEIIYEFKLIGSALSVVCYSPKLSDDEGYNSNLSAIYMLFIFIGFEIYKKEREVRTGYKDLRYNLDKKDLDDMMRKLIPAIGDLKIMVMTEPADHAIWLSAKQAKKTMDFRSMFEQIKGKRHLIRKTWRYVPSIMLLGYNLAHEVIFPQIPIEPDWPKRVMKGI